MPIFVMAVFALAVFLVMGALFVTAVMMEGRQRRKAEAQMDVRTGQTSTKAMNASAGR